ncbi:hypothetical protein Scep_018361 [Stephania cephalantha]|uniref:Uncharacterized protein n=1 Tax=Stephania cephalantha TaxID=152367 RepID=A0AAP0IR94_9MAGN
MAYRATNCLRSMLANRIVGANRTMATSTISKMKPYAGFHEAAHESKGGGLVKTKMKMMKMKGEFIPVYVALGMILVSTSLGLVTAKQQLAYNPNVRPNKKRRKRVVEVDEPDRAVEEAHKFIDKSLFRKVAHVQQPLPDNSIRGQDVFHRKPRAETLKSVGLDPTI